MELKLKHTFRDFLLQAYPFYYNGKSLLIICILFFVMTFLFNYAFEPFNVGYSEHKFDYFWISVIHSLTPVIVFLAIALINRFIPIDRNWNIKKEVILIFSFFIAVGLGQFLIRDLIYANANNWSLHYLLEELSHTLLVGSLFVAILIPYNFNRLNLKHQKAAKLFASKNKIDASKTILSTKIIELNGFAFDLNQFVFAKAEGNYLELYLEDKPQNKELVRGTMKKLEELLQPHANFIRTHRSYLVNADFIEEVRGNAQGYQLLMQQHEVPVSRTKIKSFNSKINHR